MKVLIVEDDRALGLFLQKGLRLEGHDVDWVADGDAALAYAEAHRPGLIVLDLGLPRMDGTQVLEEVRTRFPECSVLVLTGRGKVDECIRCLNGGADDFLLKPFSFSELTARCRAVIRRRDQFADPTLRYGAVEMNRMSRVVRRDGVPLELTGKEFALLEFLMNRRGECCTRGELLEKVWQMSPEAGTNVVDVYINYLRRKLAAAHPDGERSAPVIETVRGSGYRLVSGCKQVGSVAPATMHPVPALPPLAIGA